MKNARKSKIDLQELNNLLNDLASEIQKDPKMILGADSSTLVESNEENSKGNGYFFWNWLCALAWKFDSYGGGLCGIETRKPGKQLEETRIPGQNSGQNPETCRKKIKNLETAFP